MRIADFGKFDATVILAGGIASNLHALDAFADVVGDTPVILTGDIAAYGAHPAECLNRVKDLGWPTIAGNVERQLSEDAEGCGCGFEDGSTCDRLSAGWYAHARAAMTPDLRDWMRDLPDIAVVTVQTRRLAVIHGGVTDIARFLWPSSPVEDFETEIAAITGHVGQIDGVISGHSGIAFHRNIGDVQWINTGALGLPPHDGRPMTRYAVLENGEVTIKRLSYDHEAARAAMTATGLTQGYDETLTSGVWPSEDILPGALRRP